LGLEGSNWFQGYLQAIMQSESSARAAIFSYFFELNGCYPN